jgi:hypothetical protein
MLTFITVYLITALVVLFIRKVPAIVVITAFFPALPFMVAYWHWDSHPVISRFLVIIWSLIYALILLIVALI